MLKIENISKSFRNNKVLEDINMAIGDNEIVGLLGPNGAGKTTLIRIISRLILPDKGLLTLNDSELEMRDLNVVFEGSRNLYWPLTVRENLYYFAALKGVFKKEVDRILEDSESASIIKPYLEKPFGELSLGQKQLVSVISAMLSSPQLLCLDEPSNGLDIYHQKDLISMISLYKQRSNNKILVLSHDLDFLYKTVNRFIIINNGRILDSFIKEEISYEEIENKYRLLLEGSHA